MIIALCGPAGAGKGTLARMLAAHLGLPHYDFGLMFRAIAIFRSNLEVVIVKSGRIIFNGEDITDMLRAEEVGLAAAQLASEDAAWMMRTAVAMVRHNDFICDGRTCGTEIYPEADKKFYITASPEARRARRKRDGGNVAVMAEREQLDAPRLVLPVNFILIDTSLEVPEESLQKIISHL